MRKTAICAGLALGALVLLGVGIAMFGAHPTFDFEAAEAAGRVADASEPVRIRPDYRDTVIPPNIAPLNFVVREAGTQYRVVIRSSQGEPIRIMTRTPRIVIPADPWRQLLHRNRGHELHVDVCVRGPAGQWRRFRSITNTIATDDIDGYLVYRLMKPIHNIYVTMGIYQRNLQSYDESSLLPIGQEDQTCVNCHAFVWNAPDRLSLHVRGGAGAALLLARDGGVRRVDTRTAMNASPAAYTSWHPNGRLVAFSVNTLSPFSHSVGESRDVFDAASDLIVYDVDSNTLTTASGIASPDRLETFPAWSPDGRHLYFSGAAPLPLERYREIRYDLVRIGYDPKTKRWGQPETVLSAKDTGKSMTEPRVSPDGRFLLFCMSDYGNFPAFRRSSDLHLLDLNTRQHSRLACNSPRCDSWHSWSSNSRWIAFASKRRDGMFARIYLSHVDEAGRAGKPLVIPQEDPTYYDSLIKTYNVPELVRGPVDVKRRALVRAAVSGGEQQTVTLDPRCEALIRARPRARKAPVRGRSPWRRQWHSGRQR